MREEILGIGVERMVNRDFSTRKKKNKMGIIFIQTMYLGMNIWFTLSNFLQGNICMATEFWPPRAFLPPAIPPFMTTPVYTSPYAPCPSLVSTTTCLGCISHSSSMATTVEDFVSGESCHVEGMCCNGMSPSNSSLITLVASWDWIRSGREKKKWSKNKIKQQIIIIFICWNWEDGSSANDREGPKFI